MAVREWGESIPPRADDVPHYHGDAVRALFVISSVILIVSRSSGADLPLSAFGTVVVAILLVIAAGVTSPTQFGIHWVNAAFALIGVFLFGGAAIGHYRTGVSMFDPSFTALEALALLALISLYFTTRTLRAMHHAL